MKTIPLTQGKVAIVDDEDFAYLNQWDWHAYRNKSGNWYAIRTDRNKKTETIKTVYMHRYILNPKKGMEIDHKNHNGLDNRKENIRICTRAQNVHNRKSMLGKSKYKGVHFDKNKQKWCARIMYKNRNYNLGRFHNEIDAAIIYDVAAQLFFRDFAFRNF